MKRRNLIFRGILKNVRNLQGSNITIKRDLNKIMQENRKAMVGLKGLLMETDP